MSSREEAAYRKTAGPLSVLRARVRFDRNELAGAFGDLGTDLPLVVGLILTAGLDSASVLTVFGAMQALTGLVYGLPMPVQPLKAMAVMVITQRLNGNILYGAGLAIGIAMFLLTVSGGIDLLARLVPKSVVRGIQFGLGLSLASLALRDYVPAEAASGYALAAVGFGLTLLLLGNRRYPPALFVISLGALYALLFKPEILSVARGFGFALPKLHTPTGPEIWQGFLLLALPQIPLSLANSILATRQVIRDFFPNHKIGVQRISLTYSLMNLVSPFFSGIPACHGSGGMVGHYTFGARTGGSVVIEGTLYIVTGLFFSQGFGQIVQIFPLPVLGVILFFEGLNLLFLVRDLAHSKSELAIALLVGLLAFGLPYGYLIGLVMGVFLAWLVKQGRIELGS